MNWLKNWLFGNEPSAPPKEDQQARYLHNSLAFAKQHQKSHLAGNEIPTKQAASQPDPQTWHQLERRIMLPEEQELNRLEGEQAILEDQVANAELTLETLKIETALFQHHYYQTVGRFFVELDQLVAQIARAEAILERQWACHRNKPTSRSLVNILWIVRPWTMTEKTTTAKVMFRISGFQGLSGSETASASDRPPRRPPQVNN